MLILKQRRLHHFKLNALASLVVIFFVQLKADEVSLFSDAGDGGSAAAHAVIKNAPPPHWYKYISDSGVNLLASG